MQWLILFEAENIFFLPPCTCTQSTLKSVEIVLLTSKTFRSSPVPSVVYNFIVKYHRTGNICFKLFFLWIVTHFKSSLKARLHARSMPSEWYLVGSWESPCTAWRLRYKYFPIFCFCDKGHFQEAQQPPAAACHSVISELGIRDVASSLLVAPCLSSTDHQASNSSNPALNLNVGL